MKKPACIDSTEIVNSLAVAPIVAIADAYGQKRPALGLLAGFVAAAVAVFATGCQSAQTLSFASDVEATVKVATLEELQEGGGTELGKTPINLNLADVKGKVVVFQAPSKLPQYWMFPNDGMVKMQARLTMEPVQQTGAGQAPVINVSPNISSGAASAFPLTTYSRLLMKAYQALLATDLDLAGDLSSKLVELAPEQAAPVLIEGLVNLKRGDKTKARTAFAKAKALDPTDKDIDALLNLSELR